MTTITLADLRSMQPAGASLQHLSMAAWLATDKIVSFIGGFESSDNLDIWAGAHSIMSTLRVTYTYPDMSATGPFETL